RRFERDGARWRIADRESAPELMRALIALHGAEWHARGQAGMLAHPAVQRFHLEVAPDLASRGLLRLHALEHEGRPIAVLYGVVDRDRFYSYLHGFDPEFARFSPGAVIVHRAIEQATHEGASEFDFLRGREAYKYAWGAVDRPAFKRCIWHD